MVHDHLLQPVVPLHLVKNGEFVFINKLWFAGR